MITRLSLLFNRLEVRSSIYSHVAPWLCWLVAKDPKVCHQKGGKYYRMTNKNIPIVSFFHLYHWPKYLHLFCGISWKVILFFFLKFSFRLQNKMNFKMIIYSCPLVRKENYQLFSLTEHIVVNLLWIVSMQIWILKDIVSC